MKTLQFNLDAMVVTELTTEETRFVEGGFRNLRCLRILGAVASLVGAVWSIFDQDRGSAISSVAPAITGLGTAIYGNSSNESNDLGQN